MSFLGLSGYYRRFIPDYASIAAPLSDLTRKSLSKEVKWTDKCQEAFEHLKKLMGDSPILRNPDFGRSFVLQTDAWGRCRIKGDTGMDHPVAYYSQKFLDREKRYSTIEKECLA